MKKHLKMTLTAITGATVFTGDTELASEAMLEDHDILVEAGNIKALIPSKERPADIKVQPIAGGLIAPGLIDLQVNGGGGELFNNAPSTHQLDKMVAAHRAQGTTSLLPTLITDTCDIQHDACRAVSEASKYSPGILGIHLEGPFFNPEFRGTHCGELIRPPNKNDIARFLNFRQKHPELILLLTLAPECCSVDDIQTLSQAGVFISAGHSGASDNDIRAAISAGVTGFTHLFNAMRPIKTRDPGLVSVALTEDVCWCSMIADGHHVHPTNLLLAMKSKPENKLFLVSDAMALAGSPDKSFLLYGDTIHAHQGKLINAEGKLAGSAICLIDAVRYTVNTLGVPVERALNMASRFPAEFIGKHHMLGQIKPGFRADLVHLSDNLEVLNTWVAGQHQSHK